MAGATASQVPEFINYLFSNKPKFNCYFIVGNKNMGEPERIGAVKLMLMAHSDVFRCELEDSEIAEKEDVKVKDTHPETFKSMLKYVYGYDTTAELSFDEADNLLYLSEKYMIKGLKDRVATRLRCLLTPKNICSLLNNPVCYTHLKLDCEINKILQFDTGDVFASTQFLELNPEGFLKILEQEGLAVPEIQVWRAAVKWAKHRAGDEDRVALRKHISVAEKHIRLCTLDIHEFYQEVVPSDILNSEEVTLICQSIGKKEKQGSLTTFCNEVESRRRVMKTETSLTIYTKNSAANSNPYSNYDVVTSNYPIVLKECTVRAKERKMEPEGWKYKVGYKVTIKKVPNPYIQDGSTEPDHDVSPIVIESTKHVPLGCSFNIPFAIDGDDVTLLPFSKYNINMDIIGIVMHYEYEKSGMIIQNSGIKLAINSPKTSMLKLYYNVVNR